METISLDTATARSQEGVIYGSSSSRGAHNDMNLYFIPVGLSKLTPDLSTEPSRVATATLPAVQQPRTTILFPPERPVLGMHSEPDGKLQNV